MNEVTDGVVLIEAGSYMTKYGRVDITFDTVGDTVVSIESSIRDNRGGTPDQDIASIVSYWKSLMDAALSDAIGYGDWGGRLEYLVGRSNL